jgi:lipopolysaccharide/colanic/teichoic acid biosynthesis glycosyltransferase/FlaA1/EpsC-like NDP-sugar epimerase
MPMYEGHVLGMNGARPGVPAAAVQALIIRLLDVLLAVFGLLVAAPLFPVIAILIKLDSKGPVFFPAERVGKDMKRFPMYKFRTMLQSAAAIEQSICAQQDPRVTAVGRVLRRTKLNELPNLLNILRGEMSFVGPRPEAPNLAEMYPEEAKRIFSVKPGLVGPVVISSLRGDISGRNEEELYPPGVDPERYYIDHILPEKVKIDMYYLSRQTVVTYIKIIIGAAKETVFGAISARQIDHSRRPIYLFLADFVLSQLTYAFAYRVFIRTAGLGPSFKVYIGGLLLIMVSRPVLFYTLGLYRIVMELITPQDIYRVPQAVGLGSLVLLTLDRLHVIGSFPPLLALIDFVSLSAVLTGVRLLVMIRFRVHIDVPAADPRPRAIIFGANPQGLKALYALGETKNSPYKIVGFIDDQEEKYNKKISGIRVLGNRHHIRALAVLHNIQEVILAPDDKTRDQIDGVVSQCAQAGIRTRIFSENGDEETSGRLSYPVRVLQLSDMLPQVKVPLDEAVLRTILPGKTTLMMGSGGELGSAVCRYIFRCGCRKLVIVDRYESRLSKIMAELMRDLPGFQVIPVVLDSRDIKTLDKAFRLHSPQIVLHAGMRKFRAFQKTSDEEVARSNYVNTFNLAKVSARHGCEYFVVISSINAAHRGSFISESLRVAEISLGRIFGQTPTRLIVNRVGNIIENSGGVVAWLNEQILQRRPIPLPVETARAFLLSKNAAARSILQALATGSRISPGGLLLTSEPGISLEYGEVARRIASFYGISPGFDIPVNLNRIPEALIQDARSAVMALGDPASSVTPKSCLESDRLRQVIESLIFGDTDHLTEREWYSRTEEILSLCGPSLFSQEKPLPLN